MHVNFDWYTYRFFTLFDGPITDLIYSNCQSPLRYSASRRGGSTSAVCAPARWQWRGRRARFFTGVLLSPSSFWRSSRYHLLKWFSHWYAYQQWSMCTILQNVLLAIGSAKCVQVACVFAACIKTSKCMHAGSAREFDHADIVAIQQNLCQCCNPRSIICCFTVCHMTRTNAVRMHHSRHQSRKTVFGVRY